MRQLCLIRGLPGSGKSTLARSLNLCHFETDDFFEVPGKGYCFDPKRLPEAHQWCQEQTRAALEEVGCVIVSNTFSRIWEMQPYIDMAAELDAQLVVCVLRSDFGSIHDVPEHVIERMRERWEDYPGEIVVAPAEVV